MSNLFERERHTIGDFISAVLAIHEEAEAKEFVTLYSQWLEARKDRKDLTGSVGDILRSNIGWCFGEGMPEQDKAMWVKVCGASHPIFGRTTPTFEEALNAGIERGRKL